MLLILLLQLLLSRTTWVSRHQKGNTSLDLNEARHDGVLGCTGISWTIGKQSTPCSRQITTPTPHNSIFYRPDALPDAQPTVSSTEGNSTHQITFLFNSTSKEQFYKLICLVALLQYNCTALTQLTNSHAYEQSNELISEGNTPQVLVFNDDTKRESNYRALEQKQKYDADHSMLTVCCKTLHQVVSCKFYGCFTQRMVNPLNRRFHVG